MTLRLVNHLLIAPEGIEIWLNFCNDFMVNILLIAPEGIEILIFIL